MTDETRDGSAGDSMEARMLARADQSWDKLRRSNPEFFAYMEDANPMLARREEIVDLMARAPSEAIFMYLYANFMMRLEISAITGREFV